MFAALRRFFDKGSQSQPTPRSCDVDISKTGLWINQRLIQDWTIAEFEEILGKPRTVVRQPSATTPSRVPSLPVIWDDLGVTVRTQDDVTANVFEMRYGSSWGPDDDEPPGKYAPQSPFKGEFTIRGTDRLSYLTDERLSECTLGHTVRTGRFTTTLSFTQPTYQILCGYRGKDIPASEIAARIRSLEMPISWASISYERERVWSGKWEVPKFDGPTLSFTSFPFKLAIVNELMYYQHLLKPAFDVYEFAYEYVPRKINPDEYVGRMIPEVRKWFVDLPVPACLAEKVESLGFFAGADIQFQLAPQWDGEDDLFDIPALTIEEVAQFPNLHSVSDDGFCSEQALSVFAALGITVDSH